VDEENFGGHTAKVFGAPLSLTFSAAAPPRIAVLTASSTLSRRLWRQNKVLDRSPHTEIIQTASA
jgi:hypothetical protein